MAPCRESTNSTGMLEPHRRCNDLAACGKNNLRTRFGRLKRPKGEHLPLAGTSGAFHKAIAIIAPLLLCVLGVAQSERISAQEKKPAIPSGTTSERVVVRLATIDALVLDAAGRTVPGLTAGDFDLSVDGRSATIDTFDTACGVAASSDPQALNAGGWKDQDTLSSSPHRIVLAFDYLHLPLLPCPDQTDGTCLEQTKTLRALRGALAANPDWDDEVMIVALTGSVRVEQSFTRDRATTLETLQRMELDVTLWGGQFEHYSAKPFFGGLRALLETLKALPGPKALVLFSGGNGPANRYDHDYREIAALAGDARTAIYPVDCRGAWEKPWSCTACGEPATERPTRNPADASLAIKPGLSGTDELCGLSRLGVDSGGRMTQHTNEVSLGFARARRDLGCRYVLGHYDRNLDEDTRHSVSVRMKRPDLRVLASSSYSFSSAAKRTEGSVRAAYVDPSSFEDGGLRTHVFPFQPVDSSNWDSLVVIDFPVTPGRGSPTEIRDIGGVIRRAGHVANQFNRRISLKTAQRADTPVERRVSFVEHVALRPGQYELTVVMFDPDKSDTSASRISFEVPEIPRSRPFVVGPVLGRRRGNGVVVYAGGAIQGSEAPDSSDVIGSAKSFVPLLVQEIGGREPVVALSEICVVGGRGDQPDVVATRKLDREDGTLVGSLDAVRFNPEVRKSVACQSLVDILPLSGLRPGLYRLAIELTPRSESSPADGSVTFGLRAPSGSKE